MRNSLIKNARNDKLFSVSSFVKNYNRLMTVFVVTILGLSFLNVSYSDGNDNLATDNLIISQIKDKVMVDNSLSKEKIIIISSDGLVHVSGSVESEAQALALVQIIQSVPGVKDIDTSMLVIKGNKGQLSDKLADSYITAKIKGKFIQEKLFGSVDIAAIKIGVETVNGFVYLTGNADNQQQIDNAILIAQSIKDVRKVESRVSVK